MVNYRADHSMPYLLLDLCEKQTTLATRSFLFAVLRPIEALYAIRHFLFYAILIMHPLARIYF